MKNIIFDASPAMSDADQWTMSRRKQTLAKTFALGSSVSRTKSHRRLRWLLAETPVKHSRSVVHLIKKARLVVKLSKSVFHLLASLAIPDKQLTGTR